MIGPRTLLDTGLGAARLVARTTNARNGPGPFLASVARATNARNGPGPFLSSVACATFYSPPDPLPAGKPGDLLRAEPMAVFLVPGVRMPVRAWRMLYRSTGAVGERTVVSGALLLPLTPRGGPIPLVGFAPGTHGMGDAAAPSRLLARGLDYEAVTMAMVVARGWAAAVTDYQGLGTPGDHAYMVGRALGPNVLDAMRAARQLRPAQLRDGGPAAIVGYSEGGAAAAWAAQLQPQLRARRRVARRRRRRRRRRPGGVGPRARRQLLLLLLRLRRDRLRGRLSRARARALPHPARPRVAAGAARQQRLRRLPPRTALHARRPT